jgi:hypothetical protein
MISYEPSVKVEPLLSSSESLGGLVWPIGTVLSITKTNSIDHDGNFSCSPSTLTPDSILVHIIDEGKMPPAAVYGKSLSSRRAVAGQSPGSRREVTGQSPGSR